MNSVTVALCFVSHQMFISKRILHDDDDDEHRISSLLPAAIVPNIAVLQQNSFTAFPVKQSNGILLRELTL